jgi:ABC-type antimicrobial peptide transport system ATPase subunit
VTGTVLEVEGLTKHFPLRSSLFAPVRGLCMPSTMSLFAFGRARRSAWSASRACGKSTLGRLILRLVDPTAGRIALDGTDITPCRDAACAPTGALCR